MECPVCFEDFTGPIYMCVNGHSFCHECAPQFKQCPTCLAEFKGTRNFALESILEEKPRQCPNHIIGCPETLNIDDLKRHEKTCVYRLYECDKCKWKGKRTQLTDHVKTLHTANYFDRDLLTFYETAQRGLYTSRFYMWCYEELFHVRRIVKNDIIYWFVRFIGTPEDTTKFYYEIHMITNPTSNKTLSITEVCAQDNLNDDEIISTELCVQMPYPLFNSYKDNEEKVLWEIRICENKK